MKSNHLRLKPKSEEERFAQRLQQMKRTWHLESQPNHGLLWIHSLAIREIASITKIMTFYVVLNMCRTMNVHTNNTYAEVSLQASLVGGTTADLLKGDVVSIEDLFYGLMLPSGNDAAMTLAENFGKNPLIYFIQEMNNKARELQMTQTTYANPHGLNNKNNVSSAYDVSKLCNQLLKDEFFRKVVNTKIHFTTIQDEEGFTRDVIWENTNKLLYQGFKGIKTGNTSVAGPCLASYYQTASRSFTIVILGCRNQEDRWSETMQLLQWCLSQIQ
ncbi:unnamed protein product (macronuclear) [Paramecium tetraurelia]|uniref:Peptidase S11 D-alanyl-D-alanine carboxypeptidase A N-terminal domain-containing protein n=1 Tax=Paramecium tetraurelia TaxID=5888 RepID=A0DA00_PARTE|nr:uncharacterized protein GSPATT00014799001 [Paramecium tetraurelia]CAK79867.1 unnamed protein product [Paramecium tetraurelia]|eukprot:XP_001447264.1 hypothetical protein (macronuclear) [Paramecium tetraurelia strain d4-2]